ncbi:pyrroline-5-carboxylate reductase [Anseongella ginsenosidimutans]|uniref:Pyrroline-5-carboxylate reductase n=1 Tax=Anseongella ginsenosidimutans TaxID=496056 RepID=A0A4R3KUL9_9SPHI|nr:pyrroline-5-carboxylate reductase [Anseongella ginsenosidimutans]TCS89117.1 pyrroline-5-carboxylate reductase [Anseongella ginsenosidimutans]
MNVAILGGGNLGTAIARGITQKGLYKKEEVSITRRNPAALEEMSREGFLITANNEEATRNAEIIIISVLPQQLNQVLSAIKKDIDPAKHIVISIVTGVSVNDLRQQLGNEVPIVRAMPNTAIAIGESMTCIASDAISTPGSIELTRRIFDAVGKTMVIKEEQMLAATALCACGIAFFLRAIRAASQGGIEISFHAEEALMMAAQTAKGAAGLLADKYSHPEHEIDKVTSPRGCTIAGLNQMEHYGFSSAMIRGIVTSAEKAGNLYKTD